MYAIPYKIIQKILSTLAAYYSFNVILFSLLFCTVVFFPAAAVTPMTFATEHEYHFETQTVGFLSGRG
jgi:hypothetical protein